MTRDRACYNVNRQTSTGSRITSVRRLHSPSSTTRSRGRRSEWSVYNEAPPHELQVHLGGLYALTGFRYLPLYH